MGSNKSQHCMPKTASFWRKHCFIFSFKQNKIALLNHFSV